jgi:hypothetical protein
MKDTNTLCGQTAELEYGTTSGICMFGSCQLIGTI